MVHIFLLLCFTSQIFGMNTIKEQSIEPFKQNNWDNRFAQLTTDQKNQLGLYLAAYENSPLAKESLPQFLLNGLGEVELENDKLNTQKILLDGINTDNSKMVAYAFARGASSNSEQNNRSPLAQALLVSSDEICELLLENKAEVSKELVQNAIYLGKTKLVLKILKHQKINPAEEYFSIHSEKYNIHSNHSNYPLSSIAILHNDFETTLEVISHKEHSLGQIMVEPFLHKIVKALGNNTDRYTCIKILEQLIQKGYNVNKFWEYRVNQEHNGINYGCLYNDVNLSIPFLYHPEVLELFKKYNANFDHEIEYENKKLGWTPLLKAIAFHLKDSVTFMINSKADINKKDSPPKQKTIYDPIQIDTPLSFAIKLGRNDIVKLLALNKEAK